MKIAFKCFSCIFLIALCAQPRIGYCESGTLKGVHRKATAGSILYELHCSKPVAFGATYNETEKKLKIYLKDTEMPLNPGALLKDKKLRDVAIDLPENDTGSIQVALPLRNRRPFQVWRQGNIIHIEIAKSLGAATAQHAGKPQEKGREQLNGLAPDIRITVDFRNADIGNVLRVLARQNGLNIVASDSVGGTVTVALKNVTVEQALESILIANGFKYIVKNDVIVVKSAESFRSHEMESRLFRLKYVDAHNVLETIIDLKSPQGKAKVLTGSFHNRKDVYKINDQGGGERSDKFWLRSSILVVTDFGPNLEAIGRLIEEIDRSVPQVLIEARLVETSPKTSLNLGIDWSKSITAQVFNQIALAGGDVLNYSTRSQLPNRNKSLDVGALNTSQFSAVINYLKQNMNTRLVSNPRIVTMDNEPADLSVGTNFPIPQITRGVGGQGDVVTFEYRNVDITLRCTPHVIDSTTITLYVNPIIEEITGQVNVDQNFAPITSKRTVDTVVKVKNGDTIVIGGMINEKEIVTVNKVWLLGDLPLLGRLFQNRVVEKAQSDLLIFIKPTILHDRSN